VCLRCQGHITEETDAAHAHASGVDGFVHLGCQKRKRTLSELENTNNEEAPSSQDF
jgi:hypothetical protein